MTANHKETKPEPKWRLSRWAEQIWPIVQVVGGIVTIAVTVYSLRH